MKTYVSTVNGTATTYTYTYDSKGNITEISIGGAQKYRYVYDNLNQLIREDNIPKNQTYIYTYDTSGNIISKKAYALTASGVTPSGTYTTVNYGYSTSGWGDLLTSYGGASITYDTIGNPLSYRGKTLTWEGRQLVKSVSGSTTLTFKYNDEGIRTSKTVNGVTTNYYLNGSQIIGEETNGNITVYLYNSMGIIGFQYHGSSYAANTWDTYFYDKNLQGDIVAIYNANGTKLVSYTYDAWGNFTATYHNGATASSLKNPYTYRGYYYDNDLGLYYLNARYYDSVTCRFVNADGYVSTGRGLLSYNMFAYCNNNPIMCNDPNGNIPLTILIIAVATIIGGCAGASLDNVKLAPSNKIETQNDLQQDLTTPDQDLNNQNNCSTTEKQEELTTKDRIKNTVIGAGIGLAISGAAIATGGVLLGAFSGIGHAYLGVTALQGFGIGSLALDSAAFLIFPIFGLEIEPIEYEAPSPVLPQ